jgi:uncharacterized protein YndB with AHSA1/START domain
MHDVQHVSVYIAHPPADVYEFASDPRNLPRWATGLARFEVRRDGDEWIAAAVENDLKTLKDLLERKSSSRAIPSTTS